MDISTPIDDKRIDANNFMIVLSIKEYLEIATDLLENNEYQRTKVENSSSVYSLLKEDLKRGCIIPPLVLALSSEKISTKEGITKEILKTNAQNGSLLILDGLQRTYRIIETYKEIQKAQDQELLQSFESQQIRLELFTGINKLGILYRMMTLNTGQTPMSFRHQIEIIYSDYITTKHIENIKLLKEVDEDTPKYSGEYKFKDIIEGFNSHLERDPFPMTKQSLLDNIKGLEKLSTQNLKQDLFVEYVTSFDSFLKNIIFSSDWEFVDDEGLITPFGKNPYKIFSKPQCMAGFGAAVGDFFDAGLISNFSAFKKRIDDILNKKYTEKDYQMFIKAIDRVKKNAPKIGNAQRLYFALFFKNFFDDNEKDIYLNIEKAAEKALNTYLFKYE